MSTLYRVNFEIADNEDLREAFVLTSSAGAPADLTGADLRMDIEALTPPSAGAPDPPLVLSLSLANGRIALLDATLGQFEIIVDRSTLGALAPGIYRHDLLLAHSGRTQRIWDGTLVLSRGVSE